MLFAFCTAENEQHSCWQQECCSNNLFSCNCNICRHRLSDHLHELYRTVKSANCNRFSAIRYSITLKATSKAFGISVIQKPVSIITSLTNNLGYHIQARLLIVARKNLTGAVRVLKHSLPRLWVAPKYKTPCDTFDKVYAFNIFEQAFSRSNEPISLIKLQASPGQRQKVCSNLSANGYKPNKYPKIHLEE